jgi:hypothetical protein
MRSSRIFLLSPARCDGARASRLLLPCASHPLARQLRSKGGAALGDVFTCASGLYFRGKLTYARRFAVPPEPPNPAIGAGVHVMTPGAGLKSPYARVNRRTIRSFASVAVHPDNPAYRRPLARSARNLLRALAPADEVVLLGSIASPKYLDVLVEVFGGRLRFPVEFIGRGDMSRGALLLRKAREGVELHYAPVEGAHLREGRPLRTLP